MRSRRRVDGRFRFSWLKCCPVSKHLDRVFDIRGFFLQSLQDAISATSELAVEVLQANHEFVNQSEIIGPFDIVVGLFRVQIME